MSEEKRLEEIKKLIERKKKLEKAIEFTKQKKEEILKIVYALVSQYESGRISKREYDEKLNKALNNKGAEDWIRYYDNYISYYEYQIKLCERLIKQGREKDIPEKKQYEKKAIPVLKIMFILAFVGILISVFFILKPAFVDFSKQTEEKIISPEKSLAKIIEEEKREIKEFMEKPSVIDISEEISVSEKNIQYPAVIGENVRWKKRISLEEASEFKIALPSGSENVQIKKIENEEIKGGNGIVKRKEGFFRELFNTDKVEVEISDNAKEYEVYYETPAPAVSEEIVNGNKRVIVKSPDNVHYENVLSFAEISGKIKLSEKGKIKLYQIRNINGDEIKEEISFSAYDLDEDGLIDLVEWLTSSLSEAVFEIIIITKAEHLNFQREFISDIYEEVKTLDGNWSEKIYNNEYVRVTFAKNLTNKNDITFYARNIEGKNTIVEVYEKDSDEKITEFPVINKTGYYKVYLSEMEGEQDSFDLKIKNLDNDNNAYLEFDYIVDPISIVFIQPSSNPAYYPSGTGNVNILAEFSEQSGSVLDEVKYFWDKGDNVFDSSDEYKIYDSSLVAMYNFDNVGLLGEGVSVDVKDLSEYGNDGTMSGAAWTGSGKYNGAYSFDGSGEITVSSSSSLNSLGRTFTAAMWINPSSQSVDKIFLSKGLYQTDGWYLWQQADNDLEIRVNYAGVNNQDYARGFFTVGSWQYLVVVVDQTSVKYYKNGVPFTGTVDDGILPSSWLAPVNRNLVVGDYNNGGYDWTGSIDEVRIWNRVLSEDEIKQQYMSNLYKYDVGTWRLNVNQYKNPGENLVDGTYKYKTDVKDASTTYYSGERIINIGGTQDLTNPNVNFIPPTPDDNVNQITPKNVEIKASITEENLDEVKYSWDGNRNGVFDSGEEYSIYDNSLIAMYNFDNVLSGEGASAVKDVSANGNDASCTDCPSIQPGKYGNARVFDGVNDYFQIPANSLFSGTSMSWGFWARLTNLAATDEFINKWEPTAGQRSFQVRMGGSDSSQMEIYISSDGSTSSVYALSSSGFLSNDGLWHYYTATFDSGTVKFYKDGSFVNSVSISQTSIYNSVGENIFIGKYYDASRYVAGTLDEVRIWKRALSDSEIKGQYFSNLRKVDSSNWEFYIKQYKDVPPASTDLDDGTYIYSVKAKDNSLNEDIEQRTININTEPDITEPNVNFIEPPTPAHNANIVAPPAPRNVEILASIIEQNLDEVKYSWNGKEYSIYDDSLKLMYNFDNVAGLGETSSLVKDFSGNGNGGTWFGDAHPDNPDDSGPTSNSGGKYNEAFMFDGTGDYINLGQPANLNFIPNQDEFTISTWVKLTYNTWSSIIGKETNTFSTRQYSIYAHDLGGSGELRAAVGGVPLDSNVIITDDIWHHVVLVNYNDAGILRARFYVDGIQAGSPITSGSATNTRNVFIGAADRTTTEYFSKGKIDEVRIYNRALSSDEIKQQYMSNLYKYDVGTWRLNVNQWKDVPPASTDLDDGTYIYSVYAGDNSGSYDIDLRTVNINTAPDTIAPAVNFELPTPDDNDYQKQTNVEINASIIEQNLYELIYHWNGTSYSIYDENLVGMYNFDNVAALGEGTSVRDLSRKGNNGQLGSTSSADAQDPGFSTGRYNGAYLFDGTDDYIDLGNPSSLQITGALTMSAWVYVNAYGTGSYTNSRFVSKYGFSNARGFELNLESTNSLARFSISGDCQASVNTYSLTPVPTGQWVHYLGVYEPGVSVKLYVNGVLNNAVITGIPLSLCTNSNPVLVGKRTGCSNCYLNGKVDEVRIWNKALTEDEVKEIYFSNLRKIDSDDWGLNISQYKAPPNTGLDDGDYYYLVWAKDIGLAEDFEIRNIIVDQTNPSLGFEATTPADLSVQTNNNIYVDYKADDANYLYSFINRDNSLVFWMRMDDRDGSGNPLDNSGWGNTGQLGSTALADAQDPTLNYSGKFGDGFSFDGVNDYINVNVGSLSSLRLRNNEMSAGAWFKLSSSIPAVGDGNDYYILRKDNSFLDDISIKANGNLSADFYTADAVRHEAGYTPLSAWDTNWHFVLAVYNGREGNLKLYLDGTLVRTTSGISGNFQYNGNPFVIGARETSGVRDRWFKGKIDEVLIFNRSLSSEEVSALYNAGKDIRESIVGYWKLDDALTDLTTPDESGNGNSGTCSGASCPDDLVIGKMSYGFSFDGVDDYVNAGSGASLDDLHNTGMTISGWANFRAGYGETGSINMIAAKTGLTEAPAGSWFFGIDGAGKLNFAKDTGEINLYKQSVQAVPIDSWRYVTLTWDGTSLSTGVRFYINGSETAYVLDRDGSAAPVSDASNNLFIGSDIYQGRTINGNLDDLRIYNRVLSLDEIRDLYYYGLTSRNFTRLASGVHKFKASGVDAAGNIGETSERTVTITGIEPEILAISQVPDDPLTPTPNNDPKLNEYGAITQGLTDVKFRFVAYDGNGLNDLDDSSVVGKYYRNFNTANSYTDSAHTTRTSTSGGCVVIGDTQNGASYEKPAGSWTREYECTIQMYYYDDPLPWDIIVDIKDYSETLVTRTFSGIFQPQTTTGIDIDASVGGGELNWGTITAENQNIPAQSNLKIRNTGNDYLDNSDAGNKLHIRGAHLYGTPNTNKISANRFYVNTVQVSPCDTGNYVNLGHQHENSNPISSVLKNGDLSIPGHADLNLYFCLSSTDPGLPASSYSTDIQGSGETQIYPWRIDPGFFGAAFILSLLKSFSYLLFAAVRIRKKKKSLKNINEENILEILDDKIKDKYGIGFDELVKSAREERKPERFEREIKIPVNIFRENLSPAEALCKYLKENLGLKFSEIARLINRDERTVWINYKNSAKKMREKISIKEKEGEKRVEFVGLEIFSDRKLSILEALVSYLKEKGFRNSEIAEMLGKDQRNVWTLLARAREKISKKLI